MDYVGAKGRFFKILLKLVNVCSRTTMQKCHLSQPIDKINQLNKIFLICGKNIYTPSKIPLYLLLA